MAKWSPRFVYNGITLDLTMPLRPWNPRSIGIGGSREISSGAGEAFEIAAREEVEVAIVFMDSELAAMRTMVRYLQKNFAPVTFRFNQDDPATEYSCYLAAPLQGDAFSPQRNATYLGAWEVTLILRSVVGTPFNVAIF